MYLRKDLSLEYINTSFNSIITQRTQGGEMGKSCEQIFKSFTKEICMANTNTSRDTQPYQSQSKSLSCVRFFAIPWTMQSMEFRLEYRSGQLSPSPGDLPNPGIEPRSPALQVDSLPAEPQEKPKNSLSLLQQIFLTNSD